ncbi:toll-like receptor 2 [Cheilinus undulatus]|uniref:toll-like receptor 2 n=1 Tax=Cheilinus undulatus TaxID=241271 RepID=UPI001BD44F66|nr:toll-like receptor 2 [Cheilinus undulatus]
MTLHTCLMFFLLIHGSLSLARPQCYTCDQTTCKCSRQNFEKVPVTPLKLVTELDLSFNMLTTIEKNNFDAHASLISLLMNNNQINTIEEQAFAELTILEKLDLSFNRLEMLSPGWFEKLFSLQHLNLLGNTYKTLGQGGLFQPLKRLRILYFGGPDFLYVRTVDFSGLSHLEEVIIDGVNLKGYAGGSLSQTGPIERVTLSLGLQFRKNPVLVRTILTDVVHANTTLTFSNTRFSTVPEMVLFNVVTDGGTRNLHFKNVNMSGAACYALVYRLSGSNIIKLTLEDVRLSMYFMIPSLDLDFLYLEEVVLKNVIIPQFYRFPALIFLAPILMVVQRVTVVNSKLYAIPCQSSVSFSHLEYLDISENYLTDMALSNLMCDGKGVLGSLQTFKIGWNSLRVINSRIFMGLEKLEHLDISGNAFHSMPETCYWPPSLQVLNLSSSHLTKVTACLPQSLRILDLSDNALTVFSVKLQFLKELYISGNKLRSLPDGGFYPGLVMLSIQNNDLQTFSRNILNAYSNLTSLEASTSTYVCSCDFVVFMKSEVVHHQVSIKDEFKSYICDSPDGERGRSVGDVSLSVFECHTALAFSLLCLFILGVILLIVGFCNKFNVLWYLKMTWNWLRAKRKPKLKKGELEFDAFVSYSEMDSGWVEAHLVPELEQVEPRLRLCLHKRDFLPGGWILDNIMDAIERSHRTLFVLSQHFVRSEWCKYELDYTHFRMFNHNDDSVVLILLEPIDKDSIPKKFCKLRKVMHSKTYLEWPDDDTQIPRFWQSLRKATLRPGMDNSNV